MPLAGLFRRRQPARVCPACGTRLVPNATYCHGCGVRTDDPDAQPLHVGDRLTGLFNDRFLRPVLEDELARAFRYGRALGVLLLEVEGETGTPDEQGRTLQALAGAVAGTLRDVDTPGVLGRNPPSIIALLPDTDASGTAHAAQRVLEAATEALQPLGRGPLVGIVCVTWTKRLRAGEVIEAAGRALRSGRPELLGR
jgi:PleD family two-component response regulator/ribosomal protein L40E